MRKRWRQIAVALLAAGLLTGSWGCNERFWASNVTSFSLGWVLRDLTMPIVTETVCYRNGVEIDCSEVGGG